MRYIICLIVALVTAQSAFAHGEPQRPAVLTQAPPPGVCPATHPHLRTVRVADEAPVCSDMIDTQLTCQKHGACVYQRKPKNCRPNAQLICLSDEELRNAEHR